MPWLSMVSSPIMLVLKTQMCSNENYQVRAENCIQLNQAESTNIHTHTHTHTCLKHLLVTSDHHVLSATPPTFGVTTFCSNRDNPPSTASWSFLHVSLITFSLKLCESGSENEVTQSCPTLCKPMDCSPPGSSVHGIFQARVLEWVAISFSRGSSRPRDRTWVSCLQADALSSEPPGKPKLSVVFII